MQALEIPQFECGDVPASSGTENAGTMLLKVLREGLLAERTADGCLALTAAREIVSLKRQ